MFADTDFVSGKKPDICPPGPLRDNSWANLDISGSQVQHLIRDLVSHHVAVTSTLPVFEAARIPGRPKLQQRMLNAMSAESAQSYLTARARVPSDSPGMALLRKRWTSKWLSSKLVDFCLLVPIRQEMVGCFPDSAISVR